MTPASVLSFPDYGHHSNPGLFYSLLDNYQCMTEVTESRLSAASCLMHPIACFQINVDLEAQLSRSFFSTLKSSVAPSCLVLPAEIISLSRRNPCLLSLLILSLHLEIPSILRFNSKASSPMKSPVSFACPLEEWVFLLKPLGVFVTYQFRFITLLLYLFHLSHYVLFIFVAYVALTDIAGTFLKIRE